MKDYHIAQKYKNNGEFERNYVTNRYYLEDAVFVVAISHKSDELMDKIEGGLRYPYYQPFMGRRSLIIYQVYYTLYFFFNLLLQHKYMSIILGESPNPH